MARFGQNGGRFNQRHELDNIFEATELDLQGFEGTLLTWFIFDKVHSTSDPIYSVGSLEEGRVWHQPVELPVISVVRTEGAEQANDEGFYVTDTIHVSVSMRQAEDAGLNDLVQHADLHLFDRFIWQGTVFSPVHIQARGLIGERHTVVGIDAVEVNPEELVNDDQFSSYVPAVDPAPPAGDPAEWVATRQHSTTPPVDPLYGV